MALYVEWVSIMEVTHVIEEVTASLWKETYPLYAEQCVSIVAGKGIKNVPLSNQCCQFTSVIYTTDREQSTKDWQSIIVSLILDNSAWFIAMSLSASRYSRHISGVKSDGYQWYQQHRQKRHLSTVTVP